jgi:hypothetical protein
MVCEQIKTINQKEIKAFSIICCYEQNNTSYKIVLRKDVLVTNKVSSTFLQAYSTQRLSD